ncbi:hypothetical protein PG988_013986 [Apiospora saccharicola]
MGISREQLHGELLQGPDTLEKEMDSGQPLSKMFWVAKGQALYTNLSQSKRVLSVTKLGQRRWIILGPVADDDMSDVFRIVADRLEEPVQPDWLLGLAVGLATVGPHGHETGFQTAMILALVIRPMKVECVMGVKYQAGFVMDRLGHAQQLNGEFKWLPAPRVQGFRGDKAHGVYYIAKFAGQWGALRPFHCAFSSMRRSMGAAMEENEPLVGGGGGLRAPTSKVKYKCVRLWFEAGTHSRKPPLRGRVPAAWVKEPDLRIPTKGQRTKDRRGYATVMWAS